MKTLVRKFLMFIIGSFFFAFLPLVSWGFDLAAYSSNSVRLIYTVLMTFANLLVVIFQPNEGRGYGKGEKEQTAHRISTMALQIFTILIVLLAPYTDKHQFLAISNGNLWRIIGLIVLSVGYFMMNWSVYSLGKQFSTDVTIQKDHELITSGAYKLIRHPRYAGIVLMFAGIALVFNSYPALLITLILIFFLLWRVRDEEKLMQKEFGISWINYTKKTKKLIPFIY